MTKNVAVVAHTYHILYKYLNVYKAQLITGGTASRSTLSVLSWRGLSTIQERC